jgi:biopolymer transport protein ExbB
MQAHLKVNMTELIRMPLAWILFTLAFAAYTHLFVLWISHKKRCAEHHSESQCFKKLSMVSQVIINALPLIGLLGTVMGIQNSFSALVYDSAESYAVTLGISRAMLTTLLGLSLAIPGWLLLAKVKSVYQYTQLSQGTITSKALT